MNKAIAGILKGRLTINGGLPFVDSISGLAQRVTYKDENSDGNPISKSMPVATDTTEAKGCNISPERALVPDSSRRGLLYFEDGGAAYLEKDNRGNMKFRSSLTLVCWMNRARIVQDNYQDITTQCIAQVLLRLTTPNQETTFQAIDVNPVRILPQDASVFSRYTYDETVTQYLRPPFEFFAIELAVRFSINPTCLAPIEFTEGAACY